MRLLFRQKIDVRPVDELRRCDAELLHEPFRFSNAALQGLVVAEHDFELEEVSQILDHVEVNARSAGEEQGAMFAHATYRSISQGQRFPE